MCRVLRLTDLILIWQDQNACYFILFTMCLLIQEKQKSISLWALIYIYIYIIQIYFILFTICLLIQEEQKSISLCALIYIYDTCIFYSIYNMSVDSRRTKIYFSLCTNIYVSKFLLNKSYRSEYRIYCSILKWYSKVTMISMLILIYIYLYMIHVYYTRMYCVSVFVYLLPD